MSINAFNPEPNMRENKFTVSPGGRGVPKKNFRISIIKFFHQGYSDVINQSVFRSKIKLMHVKI